METNILKKVNKKMAKKHLSIEKKRFKRKKKLIMNVITVFQLFKRRNRKRIWLI